MYEFISNREHKARKPHECDLCNCTIKPGERYVITCGKYEGDFVSTTMHKECDDIALLQVSETQENEFWCDDISDWWLETRCHSCEHWIENIGECDSDKNRGCWCTRYLEMENNDE